ncbi:MAG: hybrid sensor histidine kinase/response regulator [Desulfobacteraceae bacterium]|nr:hybrid sensor histidine kinase/response regulator [Desulfobacteraceae bacterium]
MENEFQPSVLIVDDTMENLQVLAEMLRSKNYKVAVAKDGMKALSFVSKRKPDLILLDIMMPEMDGFEVCVRLKSDPETKEIPVIFISALAETSDKLKGFETGGVDYITKPFRQEEVFARVRTHLDLKFSREALKKANDSLAIANATKDKLFSIISHDLRNPVFATASMLDILADEPHSFKEDEKATILNDLRNSMKEVHSLLENLLSWSRAQRDKMVYEPSDNNIQEIVSGNISLLSGIAKDKRIRLYSDIAAPVMAFCDYNTINTVIRNLISNALKFTPESGEIRISAASEDKMIAVSIADSGVGIPKENIEKLFSWENN